MEEMYERVIFVIGSVKGSYDKLGTEQNKGTECTELRLKKIFFFLPTFWPFFEVSLWECCAVGMAIVKWFGHAE